MIPPASPDQDPAAAPPRGERLKARIEHELDSRSVKLAVWLLRRTRGRISRLWRRRVLILNTRGRRSGVPRSIPVQYFPEGGDDGALIVVAANSGLPRPPAWYFNLRDDPDPSVEIDGATFPVRAEQMGADEATAFWPRILEAAPDYARYRRRTGRPIELVRLVPMSPGTPRRAAHRSGTSCDG